MEWRTHGGDFNTKSLPLSLRGSATAYQGPVSDVGNSGPCPPKPGSLRTHGRAGPLTSPSRSALYAHSVVTRREVWILISPSLSLSLSFLLFLCVSPPFCPAPLLLASSTQRKPYFWPFFPIRAKSNAGRDCSR